MVKMLFVCMGNICRSPMAEGIFRKLLENQRLDGQVQVDSAGTHEYHVGNPPDSRARRIALNRGVNLDGLTARRVTTEDFAAFDYLLAMDEDNYRGLLNRCPDEALHSRIHLIMDFAPKSLEREVPDPYYGGTIGFERALDLLEDASAGLLAHVRKAHRL